jgi:hypothetical protein
MKFRLEQLRDFKALVKDLANGLKFLTLGDNFNSFETEITIPATSELGIRNQLTSIPKKYIIVDQTGNGLITRGTTLWSKDKVYLYNNGSVSVTATVVFMEN